MKCVLQLDNIGVCHGSQWALKKVSLQGEGGELMGIIGPNGAGKSTLLRVAAGLWKSDEGNVRIEPGGDIFTMSRPTIARHIAFVSPQVPAHCELSVEQLVFQGRIPHLNGLYEGQKDIEAVDEALQRLNLCDLRDRPVSTLSTGQQQLAWIARSLAQQTPVLLLDEPVANLDVAHGTALMDHLRTLARKQNVLVMVALHDLNIAFAWCDRIAVLKEGTLRHLGPVPNIAKQELLQEIYDCPMLVMEHTTGQIIAGAQGR